MKVDMPNGYGYYVDNSITPYLNSIIANLGKDWDFILLVTGDRMVRVGKSVLAMNIGAYLNDHINKYYKLNNTFTVDNIFWDSENMIVSAEKMPKHSIIIYDEARESLASTKTMRSMQEDILDFFNECGQLNHIFILVLPDYFLLKEEIAVARSEFLINVYREREDKMIDMYGTGKKDIVTRFVRGYFDYYSKDDKKKLYDIYKKTRMKNYFAVDRTNRGRFTNNYPIDAEAYKQKKRDALSRRKEKDETEKTDKFKRLYQKKVWGLHKQGYSTREIKKIMEEEEGISRDHTTIAKDIKKYDEFVKKSEIVV